MTPPPAPSTDSITNSSCANRSASAGSSGSDRAAAMTPLWSTSAQLRPLVRDLRSSTPGGRERLVGQCELLCESIDRRRVIVQRSGAGGGLELLAQRLNAAGS